MAESEPDDRQERDQADQRAQRLNNLTSLVERGLEPYPYSFEATHTAAELHATHGGLEPGEKSC